MIAGQCDRCGKLYPVNDNEITKHITIGHWYFGGRCWATDWPKTSLDLCSDCYKSLSNWINEFKKMRANP